MSEQGLGEGPSRIFWVDTPMTAVNACIYGLASGRGKPVICKPTAQ